jgi:MFS superfamily sulfate permease-like transporter
MSDRGAGNRGGDGSTPEEVAENIEGAAGMPEDALDLGAESSTGSPAQSRGISIPKDYLPGLLQNFKTDIVSGFVIFLIALPLCLGIAAASGAPPIAGIITGIVGGTVVALISGSYVTINGPAAGLIVIVLGAIEALGGFQYALAVGVVAGAIQIGLGFLRSGKYTAFFPLSVVHGMLAGIGIIIMTGQIHIALGLENPREHGFAIFTSIPESFVNPVPSAAFIGLAAVLVMVLWPRVPNAFLKLVPAPLVAVVVGIVGARLLGLGGDFLVPLPDSITDGLALPDFSKILTGTSLYYVLLFVFVASLESLLTAEAIDKLDPYKRRSNMNRELVGKGAGNMLVSFIGGIPMIAEVVRSSANVFNGAKTRWSNFFHGAFLLAFVVLVPGLLQMIPNAALAGILLVVGFKLAHPKEFLGALKIGPVELVLMSVTAAIVVLEDLLVGVGAGIVVGLVVAVVRGTSVGNLFKPQMRVDDSGDTVTVRFSRALGFNNFVGVRTKLDALTPGKRVILDLSEVRFIDHTVVERLHDFEEEYARTGGSVERRGEEHLKPDTQHPHAAMKATKPPVGATA